MKFKLVRSTPNSLARWMRAEEIRVAKSNEFSALLVPQIQHSGNGYVARQQTARLNEVGPRTFDIID